MSDGPLSLIRIQFFGAFLFSLRPTRSFKS